MKLNSQTMKDKKYYVVIWSEMGFVQTKFKSFKTILDAFEFGCSKSEWIDSMSSDMVEYAKINYHRILHKGGMMEFITLGGNY